MKWRARRCTAGERPVKFPSPICGPRVCSCCNAATTAIPASSENIKSPLVHLAAEDGRFLYSATPKRWRWHPPRFPCSLGRRLVAALSQLCCAPKISRNSLFTILVATSSEMWVSYEWKRHQRLSVHQFRDLTGANGPGACDCGWSHYDSLSPWPQFKRPNHPDKRFNSNKCRRPAVLFRPLSKEKRHNGTSFLCSKSDRCFPPNGIFLI